MVRSNLTNYLNLYYLKGYRGMVEILNLKFEIIRDIDWTILFLLSNKSTIRSIFVHHY